MTGLSEQAVVWDGLRDVQEHTPTHGVADQPNGWARNRAEARLLKLTRTIEAEVIPRLLLASQAAGAADLDRRDPEEGDVGELARLLLTRDVHVASAFVRDFHSRGSRFDALYLDLLAPTARHLGDLWCEDLCSFSEVTLGLVRLQQVLHELSPAFQREEAPRQLNRRALLVPTPGEQHTFGLAMVAEFFRRAGWDVWTAPLVGEDELARIVRRRWFAVVGLSLGSEVRMDRLSGAIRAVRRASRNRAIGVMVGGPMFIGRTDLAALVGADTTAADAGAATVQAERMLDLLAVNG